MLVTAWPVSVTVLVVFVISPYPTARGVSASSKTPEDEEKNIAPESQSKENKAKEEIKKNIDAVVILDNNRDSKNVELLKKFSSLYYERRKLKFDMLLHAGSTFVVTTLSYFLRSNHILFNLVSVLEDYNKSWGQKIEKWWVDHQERMANFLLQLMVKKHLDPKTLAGKKLKVEYKHKKFATVPVYRTSPDEPLPDEAKKIKNKIHLWNVMIN